MQTPTPGQKVTILPPFSEAFPGTYEVLEVIVHDDGQVACTLVDVHGAFDPRFLSAVEE